MSFDFKKFHIEDGHCALKVGTDGVLLGAAMSLPSSCDGVRMLDIGTGSGVIAIMAAQRCPGARITAIDIDEPSCSDAAANVAACLWPDAVDVKCCPLEEFEAGIDGGLLFDAIFSNPPFFTEDTLSPDARKAAAKSCSGAGGLSYREIISFASSHLTPDGTLSMILPYSERQRVITCAMLSGLRAFRIMGVRTSAKKPLSRLVIELCRVSSERTFSETELILCGPDGKRSEEYARLTEEFYLF